MNETGRHSTVLPLPFMTGTDAPPCVMHSTASAMARLGLSRHNLAFTDLSLRGETAFLPLGERWPADSRRKLSTSNLDEYKAWIGVADPDGPGLAPDHLDAEDLASLARRYIFGDSRGLQAFRDRIEERFAPFEAMLITAGRIELRDGARLIIRGFPTILAAEELVLEQGSSLLVNVHSHISFGRVIKLEPTQAGGTTA